MQWVRFFFKKSAVGQLHAEQRPGIWHSGGLEKDGAGGRGVG